MPPHPAGLGSLRSDVLTRGIPRPLLASFGVATLLTSYVVGRVLLNPWGQSSPHSAALNDKASNGKMTERERQAKIHAAEGDMRRNDFLRPERS